MEKNKRRKNGVFGEVVVDLYAGGNKINAVILVCPISPAVSKWKNSDDFHETRNRLSKKSCAVVCSSTFGRYIIILAQL